MRSRQLGVVAVAATVLFVFFGLWFLVGLQSLLGFGLCSGCALLASSIPLVAKKSSSPVIAGHLLALVGFAGITSIVILRGGFPAQTLVWYTGIPACVLLVSRRFRAVLIWSLLCLGGIAVFFVLDRTGNAPVGVVGQNSDPVNGYFVSLSAFTLFMVFVTRSIAAAHDRVGSERDEFEQRLQQSQRLEGLGTLAGGIAHDFGNIITAISSSAQLMEHRMAPGDRGRHELSLILETTERGAALTRQLLTFARRDFANPEPVSLNESVSQVLALLARVLGSDIALTSQLGADLPQISIDPRQLDRVMLNLAMNARDAMPNGGEITLESSVARIDADLGRSFLDLPAGTYVVLEVKDTGVGMPPEVAERIFEPLFTTKDSGGGGAGLGLSSCYGIVKQAGGAIAVDSVEGEGTVFSLYFPAANEQSRKEPATRSTLGRGSGRIMVIRDETRGRRALERILSEHGYSVLSAATPNEAESKYRSQPGSIDLVLAELVQERLPSSELSRRFANEHTPPPILYMAAEASVTREPDEMVARPLGRSQLLEQVQHALDRKGRPKTKA